MRRTTRSDSRGGLRKTKKDRGRRREADAEGRRRRRNASEEEEEDEEEEEEGVVDEPVWNAKEQRKINRQT
eukprot:3771961-Pyramimonas_sp.AAC.1